MKKIDYPCKPAFNFPDSYLSVFSADKTKMATDYSNLVASEPLLSFLPSDIDDVLLGSFSDLLSWFVSFTAIKGSLSAAALKKLGEIFDYDKWSDRIAEYFKDAKNGIRISTCYYCETAYVNVYEVNPDDNALYFLNTASDDELTKLTKSAPRIAEIKRRRPYRTKSDYDNLAGSMRWSKNKYDRLFKPNYKYRHHFDLDHVLPKSKCPFVALSLFNFVPCCQVCNQRLKKARVLGLNGNPVEKLSPTSPLYDFDGNASFTIAPKPGKKVRLRPSKYPNDYELKLTTQDPEYEYFINLFKLDERYSYHKNIALDWLEKKIKYSNKRIQMMADALKSSSFTFRKIKADIFSEELYKNNDMTFSKLRGDVLK